MRDLSDNARALLEAYSDQYPAPRLDEAAFEPDAHPRWRRPTQRRAIRAVAVASALAAATVAAVWLVSSSTRRLQDTGAPPPQLAPHQRDRAAQHGGVARGRRVATPATALAPSTTLSPAPIAPAASTTPSDPQLAPARTRPAAARPPREPAVAQTTPDMLAAELRLLDAARAALERGDFGSAGQELMQHKRQFPSGTLAPERATLERAVARKKNR